MMEQKTTSYNESSKSSASASSSSSSDADGLNLSHTVDEVKRIFSCKRPINAANSLAEDLEETLTLHRLNIHHLFANNNDLSFEPTGIRDDGGSH